VALVHGWPWSDTVNRSNYSGLHCDCPHALALDTPKPPRQCNPEVPPALGNLILRLLAKGPAERPVSAAVVVKVLEAIERISADGRLVLAHRGERVHGLPGSRTEVTATSQRAQTGECSKGA
jgi:hypothetical protein